MLSYRNKSRKTIQVHYNRENLYQEKNECIDVLNIVTIKSEKKVEKS